MKRRDFITSAAFAGTTLGLSFPSVPSFGNIHLQSQTRIGIIGLDTSHAPAFTKYFNATDTSGNFRVIAAYPHGSKDIQSSVSRIPKYTEEVKSYGVKITESVKALLDMVDVVLLETNDGRLHKEQAFQVIDARKPVFIDKPIAASLGDVSAIYNKAKANN